MKPVALYARISLDRQDGAGVDRQLADTRQLAAERFPGVEVVEFVDNDVSAYQRKRRPAWDALLEALDSGQVSAVVAYHVDRLYRRLTDLERFIDATAAAKAEVVTVKAGDLDLSSASGRMVAALLGSVAKHESERIGERVARAKRQAAAEGRRPSGGQRAFGMSSDWTSLVPAEVVEVRRVAETVAAGGSWSAEVARLNEAGVWTTTGRPWSVGQLRRTLTSSYVAGLRSYRGEVVGEASWPAMIERDLWERLCASALARRRGRPPSDRHLLTGLLVCGRCGMRLYGNQNRHKRREYRCSPQATSKGQGCGRLAIMAEGLEAFVSEKVAGWLADPVWSSAVDTFLAYGPAADAAILAEREEVQRRMQSLTDRWAALELSDVEHDSARRILADRLATLDARIDGAPRPVSSLTAKGLAVVLDRGSVPERRSVLAQLVLTPIEVQPGRLPVGERVGLEPAFRT